MPKKKTTTQKEKNRKARTANISREAGVTGKVKPKRSTRSVVGSQTLRRQANKETGMKRTKGAHSNPHTDNVSTKDTVLVHESNPKGRENMIKEGLRKGKKIVHVTKSGQAVTISKGKKAKTKRKK